MTHSLSSTQNASHTFNTTQLTLPSTHPALILKWENNLSIRTVTKVTGLLPELSFIVQSYLSSFNGFESSKFSITLDNTHTPLLEDDLENSDQVKLQMQNTHRNGIIQTIWIAYSSSTSDNQYYPSGSRLSKNPQRYVMLLEYQAKYTKIIRDFFTLNKLDFTRHQEEDSYMISQPVASVLCWKKNEVMAILQYMKLDVQPALLEKLYSLVQQFALPLPEGNRSLFSVIEEDLFPEESMKKRIKTDSLIRPSIKLRSENQDALFRECSVYYREKPSIKLAQHNLPMRIDKKLVLELRFDKKYLNAIQECFSLYTVEYRAGIFDETEVTVLCWKRESAKHIVNLMAEHDQFPDDILEKRLCPFIAQFDE